ncbi:unnamed protein product [Albugo candida]|uniref:Uncharacterized protein n=1 Tax=Albugo candida TaxID=65357 RepID=A0A024GM00_9STRA|nr:unnamed protein product [Albugo candida]|eukprot:CCI47801.1 unnamed protein product [Albugo candida]
MYPAPNKRDRLATCFASFGFAFHVLLLKLDTEKRCMDRSGFLNHQMSKISLSARYRHLFHVIDQLLLDHRIIVVYSSFTGRKSSALTNILIIAGVQSSHFNLSPPLQNRNQSQRLRNAPHSF